VLFASSADARTFATWRAALSPYAADKLAAAHAFCLLHIAIAYRQARRATWRGGAGIEKGNAYYRWA